jgi:hypothetical protein
MGLLKPMPKEAAPDRLVKPVLTNRDVVMIVHALLQQASRIEKPDEFCNRETYGELANKLMRAVDPRAKDTLMGAIAACFGDDPKKWWGK